METFLARQPIFDADIQVFAYELLYRDSGKNNFYSSSNADKASSTTMIDSFYNIGIQRMTGGKRAFINFTEQLLLRNVATLFPNDLLVVEVLEDVRCTPQVIEACQKLKDCGYMVVLDDFVYSEEYMPLIKLADIIKVDFLSTPLAEVIRITKKLQRLEKTMLAEKIESREVFDVAKELGYKYFQGYFFAKPMILSEKKLDPLKINYLTLLSLMGQEELDFKKIAKVIKQDIALSYKLLRLANSAYFSFRSQITSIVHALTILGDDECRKWVSLVVLMEAGPDKPDELIKMSLIRGRFLELLSSKLHLAEGKDDLFLLGLFSLIDVLMDREMDEIMHMIHLPDEVVKGLTGAPGKYSGLLDIVQKYDQGHWDEAMELARNHNISQSLVNDLYVEAVTWTNQIVI